MSKSKSETKQNITKPTEEKRESKFWKFLFWSIPAYTYFFGYASHLYYLEGLGFDEAEAPGEPGAVYSFAFNSFFYMNNAALKTAWPKYFETLSSNLWTNAMYALIAGILLYLLAKLFNSLFKREKEKKEKKENEKEIKKEKPLLSFTAFATVFSFAVHIASVPIIIIGMTLITMLFIPAPLVGLAMAEKEILEFTCEPPKESKAKLLPCTTLFLSGGMSITGDIKHKDSNYIYIYTTNGAESVPIEKIESRIRPAAK
jgi:hypothetical protein